MSNYNFTAAFTPWVQAWANNYVRRGYNKDVAKAQAAVDTMGNPNEDDNNSAYEQILKQKGLSDAVGKNPYNYVEEMKNNYALAQNSGDTAAMNTYHTQAERMRGIANSLGVNMDGFGADDSLENVRGLLGKAVHSDAPTSNDIGKGLKLSDVLPANQSDRLGLGVDTSLNNFNTTNPAFAEKVREMVSPSGESEFERNLKSLVRSGSTRANPAYFAMESKNAIPDETITADKIKSVYGNEIQGIAELLAANRTKSPWAINRLENELIGKGMNPRAVQSVLGAERQRIKENQINGLIQKISTLRAVGDYGTANALQLQLMPLIDAKASDYNGYMDKASPHLGFNNVDAGGQTYISQYDTTGQLPTQTSVVANSLSPNTQYQGVVSERNNIRTNETKNHIANAKNSLDAALYENGYKGNKGKGAKESRYGYTQDGKEITKDQATYKTKANNIATAIASIASLSNSDEIESALNKAVEDIAKLDEDYADNPDTADAHYTTQIYLNNLLGEAWLSKHPGSRYTFYTDDGPVSLSLPQWRNNYKPNY